MTPASTDGGWELQALNSIQSGLGDSDPQLASLLAMFSRLSASDEMPARERVRSPLRHPPRRRRRRVGRRRSAASLRGAGPQRAVVLIWLVTSIALIAVAVVLSQGGAASCAPAAAAPVTACGGLG